MAAVNHSPDTVCQTCLFPSSPRQTQAPVWEGAGRTLVQDHMGCIYMASRAWKVDGIIFILILNPRIAFTTQVACASTREGGHVLFTLSVQPHPTPLQPRQENKAESCECSAPRARPMPAGPHAPAGRWAGVFHWARRFFIHR